MGPSPERQAEHQNHHEMGNVTSAEQDQWRDITAALRNGLAKMVQRLPEMGTADAKTLAEAIETAIWLDVVSSNHDASIDSRKAYLDRRKLWDASEDD